MLISFWVLRLFQVADACDRLVRPASAMGQHCSQVNREVLSTT